jgi:hypothetical protein
MFWRKLMAVTLMAVGGAMLTWLIGGAALWAATVSNTCCIPTQVVQPTNPQGCVADDFYEVCYVDTSKLVTCQGQYSSVPQLGNNCVKVVTGNNCVSGPGDFYITNYSATCDMWTWPFCWCQLESMGAVKRSFQTCTGDYCTN